MAGQANVYDLTRADEPTQEGTPLNKASLLTDAVAAAFGLGTSAVPNDALDILKKAVLAQTAEKYTKHTTIGELPLGKTVTFNFNGAATEFRVLHKGRPSDIYDVSCDGAWMIPVDIPETRRWNSSENNNYKNSEIHAYLNGDFLNLLDENVRSAIKQVKIPYVNGTGGSAVASGANGLSCKVFLLSGYEVGWTTSNYNYLPVAGAKLDYFISGSAGDDKRIAYYNGSALDWWTRDAPTDSTGKVVVVTSGGSSHEYYASTYIWGIPSAFILPLDYPYTFYTDDAGNVYTEQEYQTILTDVLGNEITAGAQVEVGSYVGTGTVGDSGPNTLSFSIDPKFVFVIDNPAGTSGTCYWSVFVQGALLGVGSMAGAPTFVAMSQVATWGSRTLSWYLSKATTTTGTFNASPTYQLNISGETYKYVAIG